MSSFVRRHEELDIGLESGSPVRHPDAGLLDFSEAATANMKFLGFGRFVIVMGNVLETIPYLVVQRISLLRLDTNTFDTTKYELELLNDRIVVGGVVIVDDYGYTVGCKKAVDDYGAARAILMQHLDTNVRTWVKTAL